MKKELLEEILKINHFYNRINEAINPTPALKLVKNLIKDVPEGAFKNMFSVFGQEEEEAYKILQKTKNKAGEVESAVAKLIQNIDFSKLAAHLLENKKLGTQIETFIDTKIKNIESGTISKEKALNDLESVLTRWTEMEGIPELGPELLKKVQSRFESAVAPDFSGILSREAEEIFNLTGRKLSTNDAKLLNDVYNKLTKLKPAEIVQIENALKRITNQDGILQQSINRMKQAKDASSKMKAENLQKALDKSVGYLNIASTSIGKVKIISLIKGIGVIFGIILAFKIYKAFNTLMSQLQSLPFGIGNYFKSDEPSPAPNNTEPNKTEETW
jgi:hypothetical protein